MMNRKQSPPPLVFSGGQCVYRLGLLDMCSRDQVEIDRGGNVQGASKILPDTKAEKIFAEL